MVKKAETHKALAMPVSYSLTATEATTATAELTATRSGRHAHARVSSSASFCCCNGSVGLNRNTKCGKYVEVWELRVYFCIFSLPIHRRIKKTKKQLQLLPTDQKRPLAA